VPSIHDRDRTPATILANPRQMMRAPTVPQAVALGVLAVEVSRFRVAGQIKKTDEPKVRGRDLFKV
jgi:hypothetical protein